MALFKISKGRDSAKLTQSTAPDYIVPTTDGYAYYDLSTKLFYIDAEYDEGQGVSRQPINAAYASAAANASNGIYYAECSTGQSTKTKEAILVDDYGFNLTTGTMVIVHFTNSAAASTMTLTLKNNQGDTLNSGGKLYQYGTTLMSSNTNTEGWKAGATVPLIYNGTDWSRLYWNNNTYYTPGVTVATASATTAKAGTFSYYTEADNHYLNTLLVYNNTRAGAITLNINSAGAKPIYINGEPSSTTNYNLKRGLYNVYYDGNAYHFRNDGIQPGIMERALADGNGNNIVDTYATGISFSNGVISLLNSSNTAIATATMAIYDGSYSFTPSSPAT